MNKGKSKNKILKGKARKLNKEKNYRNKHKITIKTT